MTVFPQRKSGARPRTIGARGLAALVAGLLAVGVLVLGAAAPAAGSTPTPTPTPTPSVPAGTTAFTLSPLDGGVVSPGSPLTVAVALQNGQSVATTPTAVTLSLGTTPLPDRAALTEWLSGTADAADAASLSIVGSTTITSVEPGAIGVSPIMVAADTPALAAAGPGVYPLVASHQSTAGPVASRSVMIVPDPDTAARIGLVVPITADFAAAGLLTAEQLTELTAPSGSLTSQLDAVEGTPAILAIDPAIVAAIRALGTAAPESATDWLARLDALTNPRFALQFGDADAAVQLQAGLPAPLGPTSLTAYMNPDDFRPDPNATPTPTPTATPTPTPTATAEPDADIDPDAPVLPDTAQLTELAGARPGVYWPAADGATPAVVEALGALTDGDAASLTLLPSTSTVAGAGGATAPARATSGSANLLLADADASRALSSAALLDDTSLRGAHLTAATAYLTFAAADAAGAPVLVTLDRDPDRSRVGLRTAITAATTWPGVTAVTLDALAAAPAEAVEVAEPEPDEARVAAASALFDDEAALTRFATVLDDPALLTGPERAQILQLLAVPWTDDPDAFATAVAEHRQATAVTLSSVSLQSTSTINLYGADARLWFTVRNDLPYPVNVVLSVTPEDLRLDVQRVNPVVATAQSNTRIEVPVQARIGSGEVALDLQLRSPAGVAIGTPETVDVNVQAEWEKYGIIALSVIVGALVLLGIVRTVLKLRGRRRARAATDAGADAAAGATDAATDATSGAADVPAPGDRTDS